MTNLTESARPPLKSRLIDGAKNVAAALGAVVSFAVLTSTGLVYVYACEILTRRALRRRA